ncbi:MAG: SIMPL domain-containing protein [Solirubrobacteraceae bacterium]
MHARTAAVVALISLSFAPAALADTSTPGTLTVDGQGSVMVTPDVAALSLSVTRSAPTSAPALSAANRRVDAIVHAVRGAGVPASRIQTESINTTCAGIRVGPKGHKHLIRRCTASESLSITSTAAIVGRVIDAATHAGANSINGPDFSFANPSAGEVAAENAAITDARNQANAAAAQLGYTVTGVQSISLNPQSGVVAAPGGASPPTATGAPSTPTTVHPGAEEVDATVAVVFTIAPVTSGR